MIKVTCNPGIEEKKIRYPCLMVSDSGLIVLFNKPCEGTVLAIGTIGCNTVGAYSIYYNMENFKPYTGEIILRNSED